MSGYFVSTFKRGDGESSDGEMRLALSASGAKIESERRESPRWRHPLPEP